MPNIYIYQSAFTRRHKRLLKMEKSKREHASISGYSSAISLHGNAHTHRPLKYRFLVYGRVTWETSLHFCLLLAFFPWCLLLVTCGSETNGPSFFSDVMQQMFYACITHECKLILFILPSIINNQLFLFFLYVTKLKRSGNRVLGWLFWRMMYETSPVSQKTSQLLKSLVLAFFTAMPM